MEKYIYGAAVQGIQSFIFKTNELRDIAGASELVENICTDNFEALLKSLTCNGQENLDMVAEKVISAAGNVKYVFKNREDCAEIVKQFPKKAMLKAPGITISQAVVKYDNDEDFGNAVRCLEEKLREERNRPRNTVTAGLLGMERCRQTGLPVVKIEKDDYIDAATLAKCKANTTRKLSAKSFYGNSKTPLSEDRVAYDISDITGKNDWIAIIHADGNGLGQIVRKIGEKKDVYKEFSEKLDEATVASANEAYETLAKGSEWEYEGRIPIRPVVLGGDDMTVIIRGDLAMPYIQAYLTAFEKNTGQKLGNMLEKNKVFPDGRTWLTACAGVAFVKSSFPFYYAYSLAEELCTEAKVKSGREYSCLMFHKVQDSFITKYTDIVDRELTLKPLVESDPATLQFGPYYIDHAPEGYLTIDQLIKYANELSIQKGAHTGLRQWLTLLKEGSGRSLQHIKRLKQNYRCNEQAKSLIDALSCVRHNNAVAAGDCLTLYTILFQETKNKEDKA